MIFVERGQLLFIYLILKWIFCCFAGTHAVITEDLVDYTSFLQTSLNGNTFLIANPNDTTAFPLSSLSSSEPMIVQALPLSEVSYIHLNLDRTHGWKLLLLYPQTGSQQKSIRRKKTCEDDKGERSLTQPLFPPKLLLIWISGSEIPNLKVKQTDWLVTSQIEVKYPGTATIISRVVLSL